MCRGLIFHVVCILSSRRWSNLLGNPGDRSGVSYCRLLLALPGDHGCQISNKTESEHTQIFFFLEQSNKNKTKDASCNITLHWLKNKGSTPLEAPFR
jgi:hypothetical protein